MSTEDGGSAPEIKVSETVRVVSIPIGAVRPNDWNPNKLDDVNFSRLANDVQDLGFLQPILVAAQPDGTYRIVDGEHRYEAAKLMDFTEVPCVVVTGEFAEDETRQKFQTMRMNMIRGDLDKRKFMSLVEDLATTMPIEEIAEGMAYDDVDGLRALINDARKDLPPELRKEFDKAKEEIKTVDDLSMVLNRLFTKYGRTVPYNYMIIDFGGKEHLWVRMKDAKALTTIKRYAEIARENGVTFSSMVMTALAACSEPDFVESHRSTLEEASDEDE